MLGRFAPIASTLVAGVLGAYAFDLWSGYARGESCTRSVTELREQFEQRRANIKNPNAIERVISRSTELCAQGKYDEARQHLTTSLAMCKYNGACVPKNRT